jgi:hypothetical protein
MQSNSRIPSQHGSHTDETVAGWVRETTDHCGICSAQNSEEWPDIPGSFGCEIVAKLEFCLAGSDHAVLGLRDTSAETGRSG